ARPGRTPPRCERPWPLLALDGRPRHRPLRRGLPRPGPALPDPRHRLEVRLRARCRNRMRGVNEDQRGDTPSQVKIALAGDTMLGRGVAQALDSSPPEAFVGEEVVAVAREADLFL